ncbi:MAG: STAS domain-containing protein [Pseudomonadota bacterium]
MLHAKTENGQTCFTVSRPRLDAGVARMLKAEFERLMPGAADEIELDLSNVGFIDSAGIGALVGCKKLAEPTRRLVISGLSPSVERVFRLTRMDQVFKIAPAATA